MTVVKKKPTPLWKKLAVSVVAAAAVGGSGVLAYKNMPYYVGEKVKRVIDGDTFILENNQSIKLMGVNTPEPENCFGQESTQYLTRLIANKRIFLREPVTDQYRRIVALVYLNGKLVNEAVIRNGFGLYTRSAESETPALEAANKYARERSLGIFSENCYQKDPPDLKCAIKGNIDRDKDKLVYLTPDCNYYDKTIVEKFNGEKWFCSETEARKAGYIKFAYCKGDYFLLERRQTK